MHSPGKISAGAHAPELTHVTGGEYANPSRKENWPDRTLVKSCRRSECLAILGRVPRNYGLVLLSSYLLKRVLYVCIEQQIFSVSAPNIRVCESESFSLLHCFSISNVPVFQIVGALIALAVKKKRKTCKSKRHPLL